MADDDQYNDEYEFSDLDSLNSDNLENKEDQPPPQKPMREGKKNVRRNALIVLGGFAALLIAYKFLGGSKPSTTVPKDTVPPITSTQPITPTIQPVKTQVVEVEPPPSMPQQTTSNPQIEQKLSDLEASQQNIRSDVSGVNNQLSTVNSNVNELSQKISDLNEVISSLTARLEQQSNQIAVLTERTRPRVIKRPKVLNSVERLSYYIQAVIPGRAWLIASNGSTLTVREGTQIAGLGVVRLIDPSQGKVVMSSGRIIRFSQQDS